MATESRGFTGEEVFTLRVHLGLSQVEFASLLGVSLASVYRWESQKVTTLRLDRGTTRLMHAACHYYEQAARRGDEHVGLELVQAIALRGGLYGLFVMLKAIFEESP